MSEIVVSKFGGTSVADFDAMNRSADIVLSDANVRLVVLSASAGITNLLVALAEGLEPGERFEKLDAIRNIQFAILERLRYPNVIREEIERLLENITVLAEAAEMATFGAKVLHPATLLPAVRSDIPVFVGSSKDPRAGGTLVCNKTENPPLFRALALRRNQTLLTLHSLNMLHSRGFLAEVFGILARHNISVDLITTSEVSVALTLDTTGSTSTGDTLLTQSLLMELSALCRVEVEEGLALVALIGNDLSKACGVGKEVFGVLEPFNIRMICYGASSHNLCFLVPGEDAEQVVQKLHFNLFE
ncbi:ACT domain-containing protein [Escherichia coli]|uniref:ACT domain-containing protein n=1 Tax=Escherichia coli TaxID=562 RepID=UPI000F5FA9B4|nr:ACT domain-containing protein [Escherichia coli]RRB28621.1 ACT domain-containing protein [Escherichia coli]